ncbi:MAG TPA: metalloregulator ArsR/SmtB family transcription factor [Chloroflexota bacterium]
MTERTEPSPSPGSQRAQRAQRAQRVEVAQASLLARPEADLLARVQDVVCDTTRAQILRALAATPLNVTELSTVLGRTKWTTSRHLRILRTHQLAVAERKGRQVFYRLSDSPVVDAALAALEAMQTAAQPAESR